MNKSSPFTLPRVEKLSWNMKLRHSIRSNPRSCNLGKANIAHSCGELPTCIVRIQVTYLCRSQILQEEIPHLLLPLHQEKLEARCGDGSRLWRAHETSMQENLHDFIGHISRLPRLDQTVENTLARGTNEWMDITSNGIMHAHTHAHTDLPLPICVLIQKPYVSRMFVLTVVTRIGPGGAPGYQEQENERPLHLPSTRFKQTLLKTILVNWERISTDNWNNFSGLGSSLAYFRMLAIKHEYKNIIKHSAKVDIRQPATLISMQIVMSWSLLACSIDIWLNTINMIQLLCIKTCSLKWACSYRNSLLHTHTLHR